MTPEHLAEIAQAAEALHRGDDETVFDLIIRSSAREKAEKIRRLRSDHPVTFDDGWVL